MSVTQELRHKPAKPTYREIEVEEDLSPFKYGWREVKVIRPDGSIGVEQIPLTQEDVLFPQEDDVHVHGTEHLGDTSDVWTTLDHLYPEDSGIVVLCDCRVDFGIPGLGILVPDIFMARGVYRRRNWTDFRVVEERAQALLSMEFVSESTKSNDYKLKPDLYRRAQVPFYVIIEAVRSTMPRTFKFTAYRFTPTGDYERVYPDAEGRLLLEPISLQLVGVAGVLRLRDPETGQLLPTRLEDKQARAAAEAQAQLDFDARIAAEKARTAAERKARKEAKARAAAEEQARRAGALARQEADARAQAEARVRELEEQLRRSKN